MGPDASDLEDLARRIAALPVRGARRVVAIAGPPGSGKSTLADALAGHLNEAGCAARVVPMDGFHLDNRLLDARGIRARKGAPDTFDAEGFARLVPALKDAPRVIFPLFDRARDIAIAGAGEIDETCDCALVEGNYLLLDRDPWRRLAPVWDLTIRLQSDMDELRRRLIRRWLDHGLSEAEAAARADGNDLTNARLVATASRPADLEL